MVSKDGSVDMVEMFDDVTHVEFGKVNQMARFLVVDGYRSKIWQEMYWLTSCRMVRFTGLTVY